MVQQWLFHHGAHGKGTGGTATVAATENGKQRQRSKRGVASGVIILLGAAVFSKMFSTKKKKRWPRVKCLFSVGLCMQ